MNITPFIPTHRLKYGEEDLDLPKGLLLRQIYSDDPRFVTDTHYANLGQFMEECEWNDPQGEPWVFHMDEVEEIL